VGHDTTTLIPVRAGGCSVTRRFEAKAFFTNITEILYSSYAALTPPSEKFSRNKVTSNNGGVGGRLGTREREQISELNLGCIYFIPKGAHNNHLHPHIITHTSRFQQPHNARAPRCCARAPQFTVGAVLFPPLLMTSAAVAGGERAVRGPA
jgi:hypothetical protein